MATPQFFGRSNVRSSKIFHEETNKSYLGIAGAPRVRSRCARTVVRRKSPDRDASPGCDRHGPGGTGALPVAAEFVKKANPSARVWLSQPTWPNHPNVMHAAGLAVETYPYFDATANLLALDAVLEQWGRSRGRCGRAPRRLS